MNIELNSWKNLVQSALKYTQRYKPLYKKRAEKKKKTDIKKKNSVETKFTLSVTPRIKLPVFPHFGFKKC